MSARYHRTYKSNMFFFPSVPLDSPMSAMPLSVWGSLRFAGLQPDRWRTRWLQTRENNLVVMNSYLSHLVFISKYAYIYNYIYIIPKCLNIILYIYICMYVTIYGYILAHCKNGECIMVLFISISSHDSCPTNETHQPTSQCKETHLWVSVRRRNIFGIRHPSE